MVMTISYHIIIMIIAMFFAFGILLIFFKKKGGIKRKFYKIIDRIIPIKAELISAKKPDEQKGLIRPTNQLVEVINKNHLDDRIEIVGVTKPIGRWTKFVITQKLGYIIARMNAEQNDEGYWVNLIKAQASAQGKDQSKGR